MSIAGHDRATASTRGGDLLLVAEIDVPSGLRTLQLGPGDAELADGPDAEVLVGSLVAPHPAVRALRLRGRSIAKRGLAARVRDGLVPVGPESVAGDVSIRDHLAVVGGTQRADELLDDAPLLAGRGGEPAGILSGGERRVLGLLRAAALQPVVVVLDRAGAGLDDDVLTWAGDLVSGWRRSGIAVVVRPARVEERSWVS
ncbi:MAG: hypothetical protein R3320_05310 [Nitriliruptorales bacterium]|nr:hypothetical protein [Nitriliruptorales bacterium]